MTKIVQFQAVPTSQFAEGGLFALDEKGRLWSINTTTGEWYALALPEFMPEVLRKGSDSED